MGKKSSTTTQAPPGYIQDAQKNVINQAQGVASTPYQQYQGQMVAGFSPDQINAFGNINNLQGSGNQFLPQAYDLTMGAAAPIGDQIPLANPNTTNSLLGTAASTYANGAPNVLGTATGNYGDLYNTVTGGGVGNGINQFLDPYISNVLNAQMGYQNDQDAQQQNQLRGNAVAAGAWGGDRAAVAQGVLGGQQALANNQVNSQTLSQAYQNSLGAFQNQEGVNSGILGFGANTAATQGGLNLQNAAGSEAAYGAQLSAAQQAASQSGLLSLYAGQQLQGLGTGSQQNSLASISAQLQAGALQQQLAQENLNVPYQNYQQQLQYPYNQLNFLSSIINGTAGLAGGSTTSPGPSLTSQLGGLGLAGLGAYNAGLFGGSGAGGGAAAAGASSGLQGIGDSLSSFLGFAAGGPVMGYPLGMSPPQGAKNFDGFASDTPVYARGGTIPAYDGGGATDDPLGFLNGIQQVSLPSGGATFTGMPWFLRSPGQSFGGAPGPRPPINMGATPFIPGPTPTPAPPAPTQPIAPSLPPPTSIPPSGIGSTAPPLGGATGPGVTPFLGGGGFPSEPGAPIGPGNPVGTWNGMGFGADPSLVANPNPPPPGNVSVWEGGSTPPPLGASSGPSSLPSTGGSLMPDMTGLVGQNKGDTDPSGYGGILQAIGSNALGAVVPGAGLGLNTAIGAFPGIWDSLNGEQSFTQGPDSKSTLGNIFNAGTDIFGPALGNFASSLSGLFSDFGPLGSIGGLSQVGKMARGGALGHYDSGGDIDFTDPQDAMFTASDPNATPEMRAAARQFLTVASPGNEPGLPSFNVTDPNDLPSLAPFGSKPMGPLGSLAGPPSVGATSLGLPLSTPSAPAHASAPPPHGNAPSHGLHADVSPDIDLSSVVGGEHTPDLNTGSGSFLDNPNMALIAAGLGIAGGNSHFPLQNIANGAMSGVNFALQQRQVKQEQDRYQKELEIRQKEAEIQSKHLDAELEHWNAQDANSATRANAYAGGSQRLAGFDADGNPIFYNTRSGAEPDQGSVVTSPGRMGAGSSRDQMTAGQARRAAENEWKNYVKQDKDNGGDGSVYNLDGSKANFDTWVKSKSRELMNSSAPAAGATPTNNGPSPLPAGQTKETMLALARNAIKQGKPRDAITARLRQYGIDPSGL